MKILLSIFTPKTLCAASLCLIGTLSQAAPADEVKALLDQGKDREAYAAGKATPESLGTALFDFYFGIAALNAGVPGEGVLALERYLLQFPDNRSAQFQVARGYFILGEDERARQEFSGLVPGARGTELESINQFLDAIRSRESRYKPTSTAYVELGGGTDTNINLGIGTGQVAGLPVGVVIVSGQSGVRQADNFGTLAAGVQGVYPVAPGVALYGGAQFSGRYNAKSNNDVFNQSQLGLQGGVSVLQGRSLFRLGTDLSQVAVGTQLYLKLTTFVGEWQYQNDQFNRYGLALQLTDQAFKNIDVFLDAAKTIKIASGADVRDSLVTNISGSWNRAIAHAWSPALAVAVNFGEDTNKKSRPDLSRSILGARTSLTIRPIPKWTLGAGLGYQQSVYKREFAPGLPTRKDNYLSLDLSATYAIDRNWQLRSDFQRVDQKSTIGFFTYDRDQLAVKLRYEFK